MLDNDGNVAEPGWARKMLYDYRREDIKAPAWRIKEWNFHQVSNERYTAQLTINDISIGGAVTFSIFDRVTGEKADGIAALSLFTYGKYKLDEKPDGDFSWKKYSPFGYCKMEMTETSKHFIAKGIGTAGIFSVDLYFDIPKGDECLTMAVPFKEEQHFYLNKKQHCMPVTGRVKFGKFDVNFDPSDSFGTLDWGRGVWPYHNRWYWGAGSHILPDGKRFGFEIGWGFGIMEAFTENTLFYDGKAHKIGNLFLKKPHRHMWFTKEYMKPWEFISDDGRFNLIFTPDYDNHTIIGIPFVFCMHVHQLHGKWNGTVVLDDGTVLEIENMTAFCEHCDNRW